MSTSTPTTCPKCGTAPDASYDYCITMGCGIYWASLTPKAVTAKADHAAKMRAAAKASDDFFTTTVKRLLEEKTS